MEMGGQCKNSPDQTNQTPKAHKKLGMLAMRLRVAMIFPISSHCIERKCDQTGQR